MVQSLTSVQSSRLGYFGFWILDFGLTERLRGFNPKSKIQNPKCPHGCVGSAGFAPASFYTRSSVISSPVSRSLFASAVSTNHEQRTTNNELRTTVNKLSLLLPSRLPDSHPAALVRHKLRRDFLSSKLHWSHRSHRPFHLSAARSCRRIRSRDSDHA